MDTKRSLIEQNWVHQRGVDSGWANWGFAAAAQVSGWIARMRERLWVRTSLHILQQFVLTALLARGAVLGGWAPFGVAMVAASATQGNGYAALLGAMCGTLLPSPDLYGLTAAAAAVLTLTCAHIFSPWKQSKVWLMPLVAGVTFASCGFVCITSLTVPVFASWILASVLAGGVTVCYRLALSPPESLRELRQPVGIFAIAITLLLSLSDIYLYQLFSPARVGAVFLVVGLTYLYGSASGTVAGVAMGAAMDLATGGAYFTCTYGIVAMIAGAFQGMGKIAYALVTMIVGLAASLLGANNTYFTANVVEITMASLLFAGMPAPLLQYIRTQTMPQRPDPKQGMDRLKQRMGRYTAEASRAFQTLYISMLSGAEYGKADKNAELRAVFDRAGQEVCNRCVACSHCWQRDTLTAMAAFREASVPMLRRGCAITEDFPLSFRNRCAHFPELLRTVNDGMNGLHERAAYRRLCEENRSLVARQYAGITGILRQMSGMDAHELTQMPAREHQVRAYAAAFGKLDNAAVYRDGHKRIRIELTGQDVDKILRQKQGFTAGLAALLGCGLTEPELIEDELGSRLLLREQAPFRVVVSISQRKKDGETISGDSGRWFVTEEGVACMLLADGMGTGEQAARDSRTLLGLMERFLRAGIDMEDAVRTIAPAFRMRAEGMRGVTLDVLTVDLFTGLSSCLKCGAAPSYLCNATTANRAPKGKGAMQYEEIIWEKGKKIDPQSESQPQKPKDTVEKRSDGVTILRNRTLPLGLTEQAEQAVPLRLVHGDVFAMVTDGVSDGSDDRWVRRLLVDRHADSPKELATRLVMNAVARGNEDDLTAMVIRMEKRGEE